MGKGDVLTIWPILESLGIYSFSQYRKCPLCVCMWVYMTICIVIYTFRYMIFSLRVFLSFECLFHFYFLGVLNIRNLEYNS